MAIVLPPLPKPAEFVEYCPTAEHWAAMAEGRLRAASSMAEIALFMNILVGNVLMRTLNRKYELEVLGMLLKMDCDGLDNLRGYSKVFIDIPDPTPIPFLRHLRARIRSRTMRYFAIPDDRRGHFKGIEDLFSLHCL